MFSVAMLFVWPCAGLMWLLAHTIIRNPRPISDFDKEIGKVLAYHIAIFSVFVGISTLGLIYLSNHLTDLIT